MKKLIALLIALALMLPIGAAATDKQITPWLTQSELPSGYVPYWNPSSATALARLLWAEARGIKSDTEKAAVCWTVVNRVEAGYGSLWDVITAPNQFAYRKSAPVDPHLYELAKDVLIRWDMERCGFEDAGRVLPVEYIYFTGDGKRNYFRDAYKGGNVWDWGLKSPYEK